MTSVHRLKKNMIHLHEKVPISVRKQGLNGIKL